MKKISLQVIGLVFITLLSCQNELTEKEHNAIQNKETNTLERTISCPELYALVLPASGTGSPVLPNINSYIYKIDLSTSPIGYTFQSEIKIGATPVNCVTGLCDMVGVPDHAWAVTGQHSNFPKKLLKVAISAGQATIEATTTAFIQDIENLDTTGDFVGIEEGTSQLMKVSIPSGTCFPFGPNGRTKQYNGLTTSSGKLYAISGTTAYICPSKRGDIFEYEQTGGDYIAKYSYKSINAASTMKELGFYYDACYGKNWLVGSSIAVITNNTNIKPCKAPYPSFLLNTPDTHENFHGIFDFMSK